MNLTRSLVVTHSFEETLEHSISLWKDNLLEEDENIKGMEYQLMNLRFQSFS